MKRAFPLLFVGICTVLAAGSAAFGQVKHAEDRTSTERGGRQAADTTSIITGKDSKLSYSAKDSVRVDKNTREIVLYGDARVVSAGCEIRAQVIRIKQKD